jgi:hypothetical protein
LAWSDIKRLGMPSYISARGNFRGNKSTAAATLHRCSVGECGIDAEQGVSKNGPSDYQIEELFHSHGLRATIDPDRKCPLGSVYRSETICPA